MVQATHISLQSLSSIDYLEVMANNMVVESIYLKPFLGGVRLQQRAIVTQNVWGEIFPNPVLHRPCFTS